METYEHLVEMQQPEHEKEPDVELTEVEINNISKMLGNNFNKGELEDLCSQLGIHYGNLEGPTIEKKAIELVSHCNRHGMVFSFLDKVIEERPRKKHWLIIKKSLLERM